MSNNNQGPATELRIPRRAILIAFALLASPWLVVGTTMAYRSLRELRVANHESRNKKSSGIWGELEYESIVLEPPEDFLAATAKFNSPARWFLGALSVAQIRETFLSIGFSPRDTDLLVAKIQKDGSNHFIGPEPDFVLNIEPVLREKLYTFLSTFPQNTPQTQPFDVTPEDLDESLKSSGVSEKTISILEKFLYRRGSLMLFSDLESIFRYIPTDKERRFFLRALSRERTMLVKLKVGPQTDVEQVARYWIHSARAKAIKPLLASLAKVPGGGYIDIAHLMPPLARMRLYTYPPLSNSPAAALRDCHWTSLNFFNSQPDDSYVSSDVVTKAFADNYYAVPGDPHFGDVVLFVRDGKIVVHSAVYMADDIVFTKNGSSRLQPWVFMKLDDVASIYLGALRDASSIRMIRKKEGDEG